MIPNAPLQTEENPILAFYVSMLKKRWFHVFLAASVLFIDYHTGPFLQFPIMFVIPVALAATYATLRFAIILAILQSLLRLILSSQWEVTPNFQWDLKLQLANSVIRITVLCVIAYFINRSVAQSLELRKRVQLLSGVLPICFHCKQVRDEKSAWNEIDLYLTRHSELKFEQCLCPRCKKNDFKEVAG